MAFVTMLLCANLIGASKVTTVGGISFGAGFCFSTELRLWGRPHRSLCYARSRRVVWTVCGHDLATFMATVIQVTACLRLARSGGLRNRVWSHSAHRHRLLLAYWWVNLPIPTFGKNEISSKGKHLWMRTIGSTVIGEGIDTAIFYPLAFYGVWETPLLINVLFMDYCIKVGWEAVATPITYRVVAFLKQAENEDYYDRDTDFTPFSIET